MNPITRTNIDALLDAHRIEVNIAKDRWWTIRRNGKTWRGKRNADQIKIPYKAGLKEYGTITEEHFLPDGRIDPGRYRLRSSGVP